MNKKDSALPCLLYLVNRLDNPFVYNGIVNLCESVKEIEKIQNERDKLNKEKEEWHQMLKQRESRG
jgi:hypothetical protein